MKKISKALSLFSILLLLAAGMVTACAGDDDDGSEPTPTPKPGPTPGPAPSGDEYTVTFSAKGTSTYADGIYTVIAETATEAGSTWTNQIWISNPNKTAGVAAGDKIHATITVKSDKAISGFFFKDEFNSGSYSGIDNGASGSGLEANVSKTIDLYGKVADDYSADKSRFVIDLRGNEANTTLVLSDVKVEKLGDYGITKLTVVPSSASASSGEKVTLTTADQYGFPVEGVTYAITSAGTVSTLDGNILTAGTTAETVTIKATLGTLSATVDINVTVEKDYGKYFTAENADQHGEKAAQENPGYAFLWSQNTLSDVSATEKEYKFTRSSTSEWYGTQVFYAAEAGKYAVTFKLTSSAAGAITVNHTAYNLEANTAKEFAFIKELGEKGTLISIQLGVDGVSVLPAGTFTISDFSVADASSVTVESVQVVPSATSAFAGSDVTLLATVNNKYFVSGAKFNVADGTGVTGSAIKDNTLTLGNGKGEVSVTATYGDKTSAPVKITVTSYQPPSQDEMGGFYRYFVTTKVGATKITAEPDNWSSGAQISTNDDSTLTLTSAKMWGGDEGVVLAYNSLATGMFAKYTYIVFTVNPASFTLNKSYGVKVKVAKAGENQPAVEKVFTTNCVLNADGTVTYFIPLSEYSSVVSVADQFAIIAGGTGSLDVKEVFISAKEDPDVVPPAPTPSGDAYTISFSASGNTSAYADGAYTLTINTSTSASTEWANQIFIKNPNTKAGIAKGDNVRATVTAKADKAITKFFFKDQFNGTSYSGIDNSANLEGLEANVAKTFTIEGKVADDYDDSSSFVIDLRGNEAGTTLILTDIKVEKATEPTPTPVTFPYVVPSFTGKGDNGYTTIVKASDIPTDATKVTITIDSTKCSGSGDWWFGYGVSSWLGKVEWDAGINGYKAEITGDTLSAIKAGGLALVATSGLVCTNAIKVSVSKDTPTPSAAPYTITLYNKENNGAFFWSEISWKDAGDAISSASSFSELSLTSKEAVNVQNFSANGDNGIKIMFNVMGAAFRGQTGTLSFRVSTASGKAYNVAIDYTDSDVTATGSKTVVNKVTVTEAALNPTLSLSKDAETVSIGGSADLTISYKDIVGFDASKLVVKSSAEDKVTATIDGTTLKVRGVAAGSADITVTYGSEANAPSAKVAVTVVAELPQFTVNLNTAVNGAWIYIDVFNRDAADALKVDNAALSNVAMNDITDAGAVGVATALTNGVRYGWGFASAGFQAGDHTLTFTLTTNAGKAYKFTVAFTGASGNNVDMKVNSTTIVAQ